MASYEDTRKTVATDRAVKQSKEAAALSGEVCFNFGNLTPEEIQEAKDYLATHSEGPVNSHATVRNFGPDGEKLTAVA